MTRVIDALNAARKRVLPTARGYALSAGTAKQILGRLRDGHSADDCLHVIEMYEIECRNNHASKRWFDAVTPFRPENFLRAFGKTAEALQPKKNHALGIGQIAERPTESRIVDMRQMLRDIEAGKQ